MHASVRVLRDEHLVLLSVLRTLLYMLEGAHAQGRRPDFTALRAMLFYVAEYPEKFHHRKESELLFPKLRKRTPLARAVLDRLESDHERGEARILELEHSLTSYELLGGPRAQAFEADVRRFVDFYLDHMTVEEREILPLAEQVLTAEDWDELDETMVRDPDPLTGALPEDEYRVLFDHLLAHLPAPYGFAPATPAG